MKFNASCIALLLLLSCVNSLSAKEPIRIAAALAIPPYVISESDSGMETDIVRRALSLMGIEVQMVYGSFREGPRLLQDKEVDGAMTILESSGVTGVCYSKSHITYQNVAVTLAKSNINISSVQALKDRSIVAFQNADKYLGREYKDLTHSDCQKYTELARQDLQLAMLFNGCADVIVLDMNIFYYYLHRLKQRHSAIDSNQAVTVHEIFQPTHYKAAFWDTAVCEAFNKGLEQLKQSGEYHKIINSYVKPN